MKILLICILVVVSAAGIYWMGEEDGKYQCAIPANVWALLEERGIENISIGHWKNGGPVCLIHVIWNDGLEECLLE